MTAYINKTGSYLPERVVTNEELATQLQIDPGQIFKSSGIRERRWASDTEVTSTLGARALEASGVPKEELDYLIFGTMTPDRFIPGPGSAVQSQLLLQEIPCLDIRAACCNMLYGLQLARALVTTDAAKTIALCLAEVQSRFIDLSPAAATTSMLFGDGAAALVISSEPGEGALEIVDVYLASDGKYVDDLGIRSPGSEFGREDYFPRMVGQSVILQASRRMVSACQTILKRNELEIDQVSFVVPHQANANLMAQLGRGLGLKDPTKIVSVIEHTGNTSSASMGIALDRLLRSERVKNGDYVLMPAFGAGFTWGAALCVSAVKE